MTKEELLRQALLKQAQDKQKEDSEPKSDDKKSKIGGMASAVLQGLSFGTADEAEAAFRALMGDQTYAENVKEIRNEIKQFAKENPKTALGLEIAGSLPTAIAGGAGLARLGVRGALKVAGIEGAAYGAGSAEGDALDRAKSAATTGLTSAALGKAGDVILPNVSRAASDLMKRGVNLTPGQALGGRMRMAEEAAASIPIIGDFIKKKEAQNLESFGRVAMNEAIDVLNQGKNKGRIRAAFSFIMGKGSDKTKRIPSNVSGNEAFTVANNAITAAYDEVIPKLSVNINNDFVEGLQEIITKNQKKLPDDYMKVMDGILTENFSKLTGNKASGEILKSVDSDLGLAATTFRKSNLAVERQVGKALFEVQSFLRKQMTSKNKDVMADYNRAQKAFQTLLPVRTAVANASRTGGVFTPAQLLSASKSVDSTRRKLATAKGEGIQQEFAQQAQDVMGKTIPDSGSAGRLGFMYLLDRLVKEPIKTTAAMATGVAGTALGYGVPRTTANIISLPNVAARAGAPAVSSQLEPAISNELVDPMYNELMQYFQGQ